MEHWPDSWGASGYRLAGVYIWLMQSSMALDVNCRVWERTTDRETDGDSDA